MFSKADAYERFMGRWSRLLATELVPFIGGREGDEVLDAGTGTGALALTLRDAVTNAQVTGVDMTHDYVAQAERNGGSERIRFLVGDIQCLQLPDARFDRTVSALVLNFVPDRLAAVREMARVTKRGGQVIAAVWDYPQGMQMLRAFWDAAITLDPSAEPCDEAHMPLCRRGELAALWSQAGLTDVEETSVHATLRFASFDDYWAPFLLGQGPAGVHVAGLSEQDQDALASSLRAHLAPQNPDAPFELLASAWAVRGTVA